MGTVAGTYHPRWTANLNMGLLDQNVEHRTQKWVLVISSEFLTVTEVKSTLRAFQLDKLLNFLFRLSEEKFYFLHTPTPVHEFHALGLQLKYISLAEGHCRTPAQISEERMLPGWCWFLRSVSQAEFGFRLPKRGWLVGSSLSTTLRTCHNEDTMRQVLRVECK